MYTEINAELDLTAWAEMDAENTRVKTAVKAHEVGRQFWSFSFWRVFLWGGGKFNIPQHAYILSCRCAFREENEQKRDEETAT